MKKYLSGIASILLALQIVALSNPDMRGSKRANVTVFYAAPNGSYSEANVENNSNWSTIGISCIQGTVKACKFSVNDSYTKPAGSERFLRTSADGAPFVTIIAEPGSDFSKFRVSITTPNIFSVVNTHIAVPIIDPGQRVLATHTCRRSVAE